MQHLQTADGRAEIRTRVMNRLKAAQTRALIARAPKLTAGQVRTLAAQPELSRQLIARVGAAVVDAMIRGASR